MPEFMNAALVKNAILELLKKGIEEFCVSPGARNAPLIYALQKMKGIQVYFWPEERSSAFFALGRIKATGKPVAIITTSGTACAELLPAAIEAFYTSAPLMLVTADRPKRYRGTGAPQSIEQVGLFSHYTHFELDLEEGDSCPLKEWKMRGPAHLNICLEEPNEAECLEINLDGILPAPFSPFENFGGSSHPDEWEEWEYPLVVVGELRKEAREAVIAFLLAFGAPVYVEAQSGIREDPRLEPLRIHLIENIWSRSSTCDYPIDGLLRIGGVPTARLWRDLEDLPKIRVCSISEYPFSGLSGAPLIHAPLPAFFEPRLKKGKSYRFDHWLEADRKARERLLELFDEEPLAEPSLVYALSKQIPSSASVYLGNSLPIREWDLSAVQRPAHSNIAVNRGANGIDGQIATFLGFCSQENENWALIGDLTALYDLVAPWITTQLENLNANLVVINNQGGKIFSLKFSSLPWFMNPHALSFKPLADFWKWEYELWESIPLSIKKALKPRLIELVPNDEATKRFYRKLKTL